VASFAGADSVLRFFLERSQYVRDTGRTRDPRVYLGLKKRMKVANVPEDLFKPVYFRTKEAQRLDQIIKDVLVIEVGSRQTLER
jgi:hypothetical protein